MENLGCGDFVFQNFSFIIYKMGFVITLAKVEPDRMFVRDLDSLTLFPADFSKREPSLNKGGTLWEILGQQLSNGVFNNL